MADCVVCGRPQPDVAYACASCASPVRDGLVQLAGLAGELDVTIARLSRTGSGGGGDRDPLPVNLGASADAAAVTNVITTWAREIARSRGLVLRIEGRVMAGPLCAAGWGCPHVSCTGIRTRHVAQQLPALARWLATQLEWIRHQPDAEQVLDELGDACAVAVRIVDRQTPRWYAGPCGSVGDDDVLCPQDLYARPGASVVVCPACRARHEARARQEWLLTAAEDTLAWAELTARALAALDLPCTRGQIAGWAHRGRLADHGHDGAGRVLYRVGDVISLAREAVAARAARMGA